MRLDDNIGNKLNANIYELSFLVEVPHFDLNILPSIITVVFNSSDCGDVSSPFPCTKLHR